MRRNWLSGLLSAIAFPLALLTGCSSPGYTYTGITLTAASSTLRAGASTVITPNADGGVVHGGSWQIAGGAANGTITANGLYQAPLLPPASGTVEVDFSYNGQTASTQLAVLNPMPTLAGVAPGTFAEGVATTATLTGTGFVPTSAVVMNGAALATTYVDSTHLRAAIQPTSLTATSLSLQVANPAPGAATSAAITAAVSLPAAALAVSAASSTLRAGATTQLIGTRGEAAVQGGTWQVAGGPANGTIDANGLYQSPAVPPAAGTVTVSFASNGQTASTVLTILNPLPVLSSTSPASFTEGASTVTTLTGTGFLPTSAVLLNGSAVATMYVDSTHLQATVKPTSTTATSLSLQVSNPAPGSASSAALIEQVTLPAPIVLAAASSTLRAGASTQITATKGGAAVTGGTWQVDGGAANGSIDASGLYQSPALPPASGTVEVDFAANGTTASMQLAILNPVPVLASVTPGTFTQGTAATATLTGSGFVPTSSVLLNGVAVPATYVDAQHLTASITPGNSTSLSFEVDNPAPGAANSADLSATVSGSDLQVTPTTLPAGPFTFTVTRTEGFASGTVLQFNGQAMTTRQPQPNELQADGYQLPWVTGPITLTVVAPDAAPIGTFSIPVPATAVPYDAAARFSMQAAFGARHDVVERIQAIGFGPWIDEQMAQPIATYIDYVSPRVSYLQDIASGNSLLRQRIAWAFQTFIPEEMYFEQPSGGPWEMTLEAHAFGNFKQILLDATNSVGVASSLSLPGNAAPTDPTIHPNQNYARELMQLFSMGPFLLNDDGTLKTDAAGNPIATYSEDTVIDLSRALTGWEYAPTSNPAYTFFGIDWQAGYVAVESEHDHGAKTLFGVTLPAGQTAEQDRAAALDILFQQPNVPPFISRILIQRLVKSQPSAAYVSRITAVFKDDGNGVRGNLGAVIRAILLDPEARAGDNGTTRADDGFVQDPMFAFTSAISLLELTGMDGQPTYQPGFLGEDYWEPGTVFSYFSPSYRIPGTTINSPEFQLVDTMKVIQRSEALFSIVYGTWSGFNPSANAWIYNRFTTIPLMLQAMNHMLYHGQMPQYEQDIISQTCPNEEDDWHRIRCVVFLALNSDNYTVIQ